MLELSKIIVVVNPYQWQMQALKPISCQRRFRGFVDRKWDLSSEKINKQKWGIMALPQLRGKEELWKGEHGLLSLLAF